MKIKIEIELSEFEGTCEFNLGSIKFNAIDSQAPIVQPDVVQEKFNESTISRCCPNCNDTCWCICHGWTSKSGEPRDLRYDVQRDIVRQLMEM